MIHGKGVDDGIDRYLGINRRDERFLDRKVCRYLRQGGVDFGDPIRRSNCAFAWSRRILRVVGCCQERIALENDLSCVGIGVATANVTENWVDE